MSSVDTRTIMALSTTNTVLYEIESKPDSLGRVSFTRHWFTDYRPGHPVQEYDPEGRLHKGQCFHAQLEPYLSASKKAGRTIKVLRFGESAVETL